MLRQKAEIPGVEGYRELLQALECDGKRLEYSTIETIEKINKMLDNNPFNRTNLDTIQSLAHESVVSVPILVDNHHLVIKSNEHLELLVEHVKQESVLFLENAETIRDLIDLNIMYQNGIDYSTQISWKNELVQMQGQISGNQMDIISYYRNRSDVGMNILKYPRISDYWEELIEIDEDFFFKLRMILYNLRLFHLRLFHVVYHWMHSFKKNSM